MKPTAQDQLAEQHEYLHIRGMLKQLRLTISNLRSLYEGLDTFDIEMPIEMRIRSYIYIDEGWRSLSPKSSLHLRGDIDMEIAGSYMVATVRMPLSAYVNCELLAGDLLQVDSYLCRTHFHIWQIESISIGEHVTVLPSLEGITPHKVEDLNTITAAMTRYYTLEEHYKKPNTPTITSGEVTAMYPTQTHKDITNRGLFIITRTAMKAAMDTFTGLIGQYAKGDIDGNQMVTLSAITHAIDDGDGEISASEDETIIEKSASSVWLEKDCMVTDVKVSVNALMQCTFVNNKKMISIATSNGKVRFYPWQIKRIITEVGTIKLPSLDAFRFRPNLTSIDTIKSIRDYVLQQDAVNGSPTYAAMN